MCLNRIRLITKERLRIIVVDYRRENRNRPLFSTPAADILDDEKDVQMHYSIIFPPWTTSAHIDRMVGILLAYNFYEKELGMS